MGRGRIIRCFTDVPGLCGIHRRRSLISRRWLWSPLRLKVLRSFWGPVDWAFCRKEEGVDGINRTIVIAEQGQVLFLGSSSNELALSSSAGHRSIISSAWIIIQEITYIVQSTPLRQILCRLDPGLTHPISSLLSHVKAVHPNHRFSSPPILTEKKQYSQSTSPTPRLRSKPNPSLNRRNSCLGQSTQAHDYHRRNMQYTVTEATSTATWRIRRGRMCVRGTCRFYSCGLRMFIASAESAELAYCSRFEILLLSIERCDASTA